MEEQFIEILNNMQFDVIVLLIKMMFAGIFVFIIKDWMIATANYLRLRFSDLVATNLHVTYNNFKGKITKISIWGVKIENDEGDYIVVPLSRWQYGECIYNK